MMSRMPSSFRFKSPASVPAAVCVVLCVVSLLFGRAWGARQLKAPGFSASTTGAVVGIGQAPPASLSMSEDVEFLLFWDLWKTLKEKYYQKPINDKDLFYGAMTGLAASLGDPYTNFFPPKVAEEFEQSLAGKFEGIGAEIGLKDDRVQVVAPLPDTPAERAGLLAGDIITAIDGKDTAGMSVEEAVTMIRGEKGTTVVLMIARAGSKNPPFEVPIVRDEIQIKSVRTKDASDGIFVIEVTHFNGDTRDGFDKAVDQALAKGAKGIILDLRNNPGGFLDMALSMAGEWVGDQVIVKERRQGEIVEVLRGTGRKRLSGIPTVVLVNQGSASASEIVAGALQDYHQATIVGMQTFGKGSVQDYENFVDGSGVKITIAEWLTPDEHTINKTGLTPDVVVDRSIEDYEANRDPQFDRAIGILNGTATGTTATVPLP